jgi:Uma2 family endonuclease
LYAAGLSICYKLSFGDAIIQSSDCYHQVKLNPVPDLAGWRRDRMPELPETAWFELVPDWVCEILSPSTARTDRIIKMPIYAREGIKHIWLVDPDLKTLEVYQLYADGHWTLIGSLKDDDTICQPPFDAVEFSLGVLWG